MHNSIWLNQGSINFIKLVQSLVNLKKKFKTILGVFAEPDVSHLSGVLKEDGYHYDKPIIPFPPVIVTKQQIAETTPKLITSTKAQIITTQPPTYLPPVEECPLNSADPKCCAKGSKNPACNPTTTTRRTTWIFNENKINFLSKISNLLFAERLLHDRQPRQSVQRQLLGESSELLT